MTATTNNNKNKKQYNKNFSKNKKYKRPKRRYSKLTIYLRQRVYMIIGIFLLLIIIGIVDRGKLIKVINNQWKTIENANSISNLQELWPWDHALVDPNRYYTGPGPGR